MAEMADLDIREAAGEFDRQTEVHHMIGEPLLAADLDHLARRYASLDFKVLIIDQRKQDPKFISHRWQGGKYPVIIAAPDVAKEHVEFADVILIKK